MTTVALLFSLISNVTVSMEYDPASSYILLKNSALVIQFPSEEGLLEDAVEDFYDADSLDSEVAITFGVVSVLITVCIQAEEAASPEPFESPLQEPRRSGLIGEDGEELPVSISPLLHWCMFTSLAGP